jgi:tetratricopeptide (TPR) repeat protein
MSVAALLLWLGVAQASTPVSPVPSLPVPRILVVPFETPARDGRTYWLGEALAVLVADDLNARGLGAITRTARERAYDQLHLPPNAVLSRATVIRVGQIVGAEQVIVGEVEVDGDALTMHLRPIRIDVGRAGLDVTEHGKLEDLFALASRAIRRAVPGGSGSTATPAPPSLQTFEQYIKGLLAEQPASQASFLETALKLDPSYDRARVALWEVRTAQGDYAAALAAVKRVSKTSPASRRARFLAALSMMGLKQYDEAFAALKALQEESPSGAVLNNLGVLQIRRGATAETGKPTYYFTQATKSEPDDPDFLFNLGYAYALDRDPQGAIYWLREAVRRNPADGDAHLVLAAELDAAGRSAEAVRERELAAQLSSKYAEAPRRSGADALPQRLERPRADLEPRPAQSVDRAIVNTTQRDQQEMAQFHLDRGRRLFEREQDAEALAELRRAVFLSPYEAQAHLLIGRIHLRGSRPKEAVDALKISIWSQDTAAAHVALAEAYLLLKDVPNARAEVQRALKLEPASVDARRLLDRIDRGGL